MFNKQDIQDDNKYSFIKEKLSDDFSIQDDDRSKVIFGYNGIGKTTLFRFIKEYKDDNRLVFLDYIDERDTFVKKKKKITISANLNRISELESEMSNIKDEMNVNGVVKDIYDITNATKAQVFGQKMVEAKKNNFTGFDLNRIEMEVAINQLGGVSAKFIVKNRDILEEARNLTEEINDYKSSFIYKALIPLTEIVKPEDNVCPICDSDKNDIFDIINRKIESLNEVSSKLIESMKVASIVVSEDIVNDMMRTISILDSNDKLADWMICNGDIHRYDLLLAKQTELENKKRELSGLQTQRDNMYNLLSSIKDVIKEEISRYFYIEEGKVKFSNSKKTLTITLDREVNTYSTGEMNFFAFMIKIYEFISSDKTILLLDDPVSSLDIMNHYKIAYELVKTAASGKRVIILTHSVELLNSINSQYGEDFDFYYIDETSENLIIQNIDGVRNGRNVLTLDRLLELDNIEIIKALIKKENSNNTESIHKLFHYDGMFTHPEFNQFDNDSLVDMITNYPEIANVDFLSNTYNKVIHIAALRVWVEKKLRDLIVNNQNLLDGFDREFTITSKINLLFPRNGTELVEKPEKFTRQKILSKKVMLNQGIHYQSQVMPFAYALNISIHDLNKEIEEIKGYFLQEEN